MRGVPAPPCRPDCRLSPRAVLFDLGGVLVDWNPRHLYRRIFADAAAMEQFLATVCTQAWNEEQDAGRPFAEAVALLLQRYPEHEAAIRAYDERWEEMLAGAIADSVAILDELHRRGVPLYALTNWSAEKFPAARARFDFLACFSGIIVSGEEKLKKPDPRIFRLAAERFGLDPAATLFVDDSAHNVMAAAALGFRGCRFVSPAALRLALVGHGLLPG